MEERLTYLKSLIAVSLVLEKKEFVIMGDPSMQRPTLRLPLLLPQPLLP